VFRQCDILLVLTKQRFRECGKTSAYSANIEFNVIAHGEHIREMKAPTENSNKREEKVRKRYLLMEYEMSQLITCVSVLLPRRWIEAESLDKTKEINRGRRNDMSEETKGHTA
jgi:hypothetical protein